MYTHKEFITEYETTKVSRRKEFEIIQNDESTKMDVFFLEKKMDVFLFFLFIFKLF